MGETGDILYDKCSDEHRPNASTTKILTCILAIECGNLADDVTASSYASKMPEVRLGVRDGEKYTLEDMLYAMMLESYNDAAVVIAEHIGGSVQHFAEMMNAKAEEIGAILHILSRQMVWMPRTKMASMAPLRRILSGS